MNRFIYACLFLLLLHTGCKKTDLDATAIKPEVNSEVLSSSLNSKTVTTVDGTQVGFTATTIILKTGEIYRIVIPDNWNGGDLILYAHGYVSPFAPLAISTESDAFAPLFISQGYAFATTSYSANGLAIQTGIENMLDLRKFFIKQYGTPRHIYLTGGSEGGIVTTLAAERYPSLFSGTLSLCSPCGDFQRQINHYGDFRVLFDYYFPGVLPGNAIDIPNALIENWNTYATIIIPLALQADFQSGAEKIIKLLATSGLGFVPPDPASIGQAIIGLLWYDVFATGNANVILKGQPFDNSDRVYVNPLGTYAENVLLNQQVQRFSADKKAAKVIEKDYQTNGNLRIPLVKLHTDGDFLIPFWHLSLYGAKVAAQGASALFTGIPVLQRFGHCTFNELEIATGFGTLVQKVTGQLPGASQRLIAAGTAANGKIVQSVAAR